MSDYGPVERRIGKYLVERALGAGSFATVWLAHDELLDDRVAIKVLAENWARDDDIRRRFVDEAKILRRIDHALVIRVHVIDTTDDGRPYFVMSWADRGTLQDRLLERRASEQPLATDEVLQLSIDMLESLAVVHDFGVVHRDVKPSNVLFRSVASHERNAAHRSGSPVGDELLLLADFGLAKDLAGASGFTQAAGTPAYMAPEQSHTSSTIDQRADIYSASAILYEMLAGHTPFSADTLSGVRRDRSDRNLVSLGSLRPDLPADLVAVVGAGLATNPNERPSGTELMAALRSIAARGGAPENSAVVAPVGAAGRVLDLIERSRATLPGHAAVQDLFDDAEVALGADVTVLRLDRGDELPVEGLAGVDLVVGVVEVHPTRRPGSVGPLAVLSPDDYDDAELDRIVTMLVDGRRLAVQAGRGLTSLRLALDSVEAADRSAVGELVDQMNELDTLLPGLLDLSALRQSTSGSGALPGALAFEFRRLLLEVEPARRLGLDPYDSSLDLGAATAETLDRWRTLLNGGRIPFSARPLVQQLIRSLERLWSNVAD